jgi:hypothetical protein
MNTVARSLFALAIAASAGPVRADMSGWELLSLGWDGGAGLLDERAPPEITARVVEFRWVGEGRADLEGFDYAGACHSVLAFLDDMAGETETITVRAREERQSGILSIRRGYGQTFEVVAGRCVPMGEGIAL